MLTKICISTLVLLFATLILPFSASAQNTRYKLIDLGTLGGPNSGLSGPGVQPLNNDGTFAGYANTATPNPNPGCFIAFSPADCFVEHPFVWQNGTVATLPVLPGGNNTAPSWISSSGLIAGASENGLIDPMTGLPKIHAVLWAKDRQIIDLGTVTGGTQSLATSINSRGQIVGFSNNDVLDPFSLAGFPFATQTRAFLWQNGAIQDLGTLGGPDAFPNDINEQGQIAGMSYTNSWPNPITGMPTLDPFLWEGGTMIDFGTLGGTLGVESWLNSSGQVVGTMNLAGDVNSHGFLWDRGSLLDLGTLGGNNSKANWINDAGHIVGSADYTPSITSRQEYVPHRLTVLPLTEFSPRRRAVPHNGMQHP